MTKDDPLKIKLNTSKDLVDPKKPCINLPDPVKISVMKETDTDFSEMFSKSEANIKMV